MISIKHTRIQFWVAVSVVLLLIMGPLFAELNSPAHAAANQGGSELVFDENPQSDSGQSDPDVERGDADSAVEVAQSGSQVEQIGVIDGDDNDTPIAPDERRVTNGELCRTSGDGFVEVDGTKLVVDLSKAGDSLVKVSFRHSAFAGCAGKYTDVRFINPAPSNVFVAEFGRTENLLDTACGEELPEGAIENSSTGLKMKRLELPGNLAAIGIGDAFFAQNGRRNSNGVYPLEELKFGDNTFSYDIGGCAFVRVMPDSGGGNIDTKPLAIRFPSANNYTIYRNAFAELNHKGTVPSCITRNGFSEITFAEGIKQLELRDNSFDSQCSNVRDIRFPDSLTELRLLGSPTFGTGTSDLQKVSFPGMQGNGTKLELAAGAFGSKNVTDVEVRSINNPAKSITIDGNPFQAATTQSASMPIWQWSGQTGQSGDLWGTKYSTTVHGYYPLTFNNVYGDVVFDKSFSVPMSFNAASAYMYGGDKGLKSKSELTGFDANASRYSQIAAPTTARDGYVLEGWCKRLPVVSGTCPAGDLMQPGDMITVTSSPNFWATWTDRPSVRYSSFKVDEKSVAAGKPVQVTLKLITESQQPLATANSVVISATDIQGETVEIADAKPTSTPGEFTAALTSNKSGISTVTVKIKDGTPLENKPAGTDKATWIPGPADVDSSDFFVDQQPVVVKEGTVPVTVTARDSHGNVTTVSKSDISATACIGGDCKSASVSSFESVGTGDSQKYVGQVSAEKSGVYTVSARLSGKTLPVQKSKSALATFRSGAIDVSKSSFVVGTSPAVADGQQVVPILVSLADANGVPIADFADYFKPVFAPAQGVKIVPSKDGGQFVNNNDGTYTVNIASTNAGNVLIGMGTDGGGMFSLAQDDKGNDLNDTARFVAGDPDLKASQTRFWTSNTDGIVVGEGPESQQTLYVSIVDSNNNPVSGLEANLKFNFSPSASNGPSTSEGFRWNSDTQVYEAVLTSKYAATFVFGVTLDGKSVTARESGPTVATWLPGEPTFGGDSSSHYEVASRQALANGSDTVPVTIRVFDKYDNPVPGISGQLQVTALGNKNWQVTEKTGESGAYQTLLTSKKAGRYAATAEGNGTAIALKTQGNSTATFVADAPSADRSAYNVDKAPVLASGTATVPVCVFLLDEHGNPALLGDVSMNATVDEPAQISSFRHVEEDDDVCGVQEEGVYVADVSSNSPGEYGVTVTLGGRELNTVSQGNRTAYFVVDNIDRSASSYEVSDHEGIIANGEDRQTVQVALVNTAGNPVRGATQMLDASMRIDQKDGTSKNLEITSFSETAPGTYSADVTSTTPGRYEIDVLVESECLKAKDSHDSTHFDPGPASNSTSSFSVSEYANVVANGRDHQDVTVHLRDEYGNPTTQLPAGDSLSVGGELLESDEFQIDEADFAVPVRSTVAGSHAVTVKIGASMVEAEDNDRAQFIAGEVSTAKSSFEITDNENVVANGVDLQTATVTLQDEFGNPLDAHVSQIVLAFDPQGPSVSEAGWLKTGPGVYEAAVVSTKAGRFSAVLRYQQTEISPENGLDTTRFMAGAPVAANSSFEVGTDSAVAGEQTVPLTVTLRDAHGNNAALPEGAALEAQAQEGDNTADISVFTSTGTTFETVYTAQISAQIAGTYMVLVQLNENDIAPVPAGNDKAIFVAGAPVAENSRFTVTQWDDVIADGVGRQLVDVMLRDAYGNAAELGDDTFLHADATNETGTASVGDFNRSDDMYQAAITSTRAGEYVVNVEMRGGDLDEPITVDGSDIAAFVPGEVSVDSSRFEVGSEPAITVSGEIPVNVTLLDATGNPVPGQEDQLRAAFNEREVSEFRYEDGQYSAVLTSRTIGDFPVVVTYGVDGLLKPADSEGNRANDIAHFVGGPAVVANSYFAVSEGERVANRDAHQVTVTARDAGMNEVPVPEEWKLSAEGSGRTTQSQAAFGAFDSVEGPSQQASITASDVDDYEVTVQVTVDGEMPQTLLAGDGVNTVARFVAGVPSMEASYYSVTNHPDVVANASDTQEIHVVLVDDAGNIVAGQEADLAFTEAPVGLTGAGEWTFDGAEYVLSVTSTVAGTYTVATRWQDLNLPVREIEEDSTSFIPGTADIEQSSFTVSDLPDVQGDGESEQTVTVTWRDAFGNNTSLPTTWTVTGVAINGDGIEGIVKEFVLGEEQSQHIATVVSDHYGEFDVSVFVEGKNQRTVLGEITPDGNRTARFTPQPSPAPEIAGLTKAEVSGIGVPGASIIVTDSKGNHLCGATVSSSGEWWCSFGTPIAVGTIVQATQTIPGKGPSDPVSKTLQGNGGNGGDGGVGNGGGVGTGESNHGLSGNGSDAEGLSGINGPLAQTGVQNIWMLASAGLLFALGVATAKRNKR